MTRGRGGWLDLTPCRTFTCYTLPALPGVLGKALALITPQILVQLIALFQSSHLGELSQD